jgi:hypothetical protein
MAANKTKLSATAQAASIAKRLATIAAKKAAKKPVAINANLNPAQKAWVTRKAKLAAAA